MAGDYAKDREYNFAQKAAVVTKHLYELVARGESPRVTSHMVRDMLGCHLVTAYRLLDVLAEVLGLYKEGPFYVMVAE